MYRQLLNISFLVAFAFTLSCGTKVVIPEHSSNLSPLENWQIVLSNSITDRGQINYKQLARHRQHLEVYTSYIQTVNLSDLNKNESLAFHLNSYNALALYSLLLLGKENYSSKIENHFQFNIAGKKTTLKKYKENVLRELGDERIHFAIGELNTSSPKLSRKVFKADIVLHQLIERSLEFINDDRNFYIDHEQKAVYLSPIFKNYGVDFVPPKANSLIDYVNEFSKKEAPRKYKERFYSVKWQLNAI